MSTHTDPDPAQAIRRATVLDRAWQLSTHVAAIVRAMVRAMARAAGKRPESKPLALRWIWSGDSESRARWCSGSSRLRWVGGGRGSYPHPAGPAFSPARIGMHPASRTEAA